MICQHNLFLLSLSSVIHFLGCYLLLNVLNLACVTLILQWGVKSASPSSLPHHFLTIQSTPPTVCSLHLNQWGSWSLCQRGWAPSPLSLYSPIYILPTPPSQPNVPMKRYQPLPPSVTCAAVVQARTAFEGRVSVSWGSLSGKKHCWLLALYLGAYFTSRVAHLFL